MLFSANNINSTGSAPISTANSNHRATTAIKRKFKCNFNQQTNKVSSATELKINRCAAMPHLAELLPAIFLFFKTKPMKATKLTRRPTTDNHLVNCKLDMEPQPIPVKS